MILLWMIRCHGKKIAQRLDLPGTGFALVTHARLASLFAEIANELADRRLWFDAGRSTHVTPYHSRPLLTWGRPCESFGKTPDLAL